LSKSEENIETSAKKWASALSDKTARAKAEEAARIILRHGIELPVIKESGRMKKRTLAQFRSDGTPTIEVNKKLNDDFWKRDARSVEIGWAAQDNPILHELGHYIDFICNKEKYNKQSENKRFFGETKSLIEKEVSIYAATDQWELEAELYAGIMRGKVYSNNVLNLSRISQSDNDIIKRLLSYGTGQDVCLPSEDISKQFKNMMKVLFQQEGSSFSINIMADKDVQKMIETHSSVLNGSFRQVEMSEAMRKRLERSNYVFSGLKTFHELNEAFPSLLDENGNRKTFERFLNDVRKIDETYNSNYLRAEFNFVQASAEMAAKWERFMQDGDRYYLQYRTAGDAKVRPTHAEMAGITLPASDPFWEEFYPPNGWGCRCSVIQVRKSKYPATDHEEAMARGESALELDKKGMFRFNAGMEQKTMPDYNPYTIKRCKDCDIAKGKLKLAFVPDNELCAACKLLQKCVGDKDKSQRAIERTHYLHEMEPLLQKKVEKTVNGKNMNIGFTKDGNKHLFSDTFGRTRIVSKEELKNLDSYLERAEYVDDSALTHPRTDNVEHYYYFKVRINGKWARLNVAKEVHRQPNGKVQIKYFLYSINDIKE
jgi:SPP1 gp7 family putative phage head morphogenesis protein